MQQTPQIEASFILDNDGKPKRKLSEKHKHYEVQLSVKDVPGDTYAVTYFLHPTYYNSVREVRDRDSNFAEDLTSYGDYEIQAKIRSSEYPLPLRRNLYEALAETYTGNTDTGILQALTDIKEN
uniref:Prokaryotic YEATS domain-containing protein n=1 Tax=Candidatus Kentrum sp. LPFa TaxID=2126335 RepID=A0A450X2V2_9GAMM|nr:MAG: hypothetical protein BECKLPF1236A_GA0070988_102923 [Candidatus Kentron sp. LPFa]VFK23598.1 MAG: hypothetical protein BECKLPF1236C_GA0070990_1000633 [Candidatus Kentron sp. LPFa]